MSCDFCKKNDRGLRKLSIFSEGDKEHIIFLNDEDQLACFTLDDYDSGRYFKINFCPKCGESINGNRPKVVCLCGSTRFADAFQWANLQLTIAGQIVLSIGCNTKSDSDLLALGELTEDAKAALDELHKRKIDLADEILVLNVGGYIGTSTRSEIEYARHLGKTIRYLEPIERQMI